MLFRLPRENREGYTIGEETLVGAMPCLLYTSDAADERSSVDLGGRRNIKKKNEKKKNNSIGAQSKQHIMRSK